MDSTQSTRPRPNPRSRSSTMRSYPQPEPEPEPMPEARPTIRSNTSRVMSQNNSPRPAIGRSTTYDSPRRDLSPAYHAPLARVPSDSLMIKTARMNLRTQHDGDVFADDSSPDTTSYGDRASSPATSNGSSSARRAPPPPPPSRSKKPPPPVPQKRASVSYNGAF